MVNVDSKFADMPKTTPLRSDYLGDNNDLGRALLRLRDALNNLNQVQRADGDDIPAPLLNFNDFYQGEAGYELKPDETGLWRVTYHPAPETFLLEW